MKMIGINNTRAKLQGNTRKREKRIMGYVFWEILKSCYFRGGEENPTRPEGEIIRNNL